MLIHIGYHKTGSTLLQKLLFSNPEAEYAVYSGARECIHEGFVSRGVFSAAKQSVVDEILQERDVAVASGKTLVLSHERLSGYPAEGGVDAKQIADRLAAAFPDARILIGVREQVSLIASYYSQYITDGGGLSLARLLDAPEKTVTRQHSFDLRYYEFDQLVDYYRSLFGADRVLVAPFEFLRLNPSLYVKAILDLTGSGSNAFATQVSEVIRAKKVNPAKSQMLQSAVRLTNRHLSRTQLANYGLIDFANTRFGLYRYAGWLDNFRLFDASILNSRRHLIETAVGSRFAASNVRLAESTGLDFAGLGYSVLQSGQP